MIDLNHKAGVTDRFLIPLHAGGKPETPVATLRIRVYFLFRLFAKLRTIIPVPDTRLQVLKTLASPMRLQVLELLKEPAKHFPPQTDGDLLKDGVCADYIRDKLGIAAATASRHLNLMAGAGLVIATRKKGWTFYRRNEKALSSFTRQLRAEL